jgi:hypothetical protein
VVRCPQQAKKIDLPENLPSEFLFKRVNFVYRAPGGWLILIKNVAQLRSLLLEMETSLGLLELSQNERDVLYALQALSGESTSGVRSEAIRSHPLAASIPQASYHRALRGLLDRRLIDHAPHTRSGIYIVK